MNINEVAAGLDGSEYPLEVSAGVRADLKANGLVLVFGASDDLMEFDGAIYDEVGCYDGGTAYVDALGLLDRDRCETDEEIADFVARKKVAKKIKAVWAKDNISWQYETDIPHATFKVIEDGDTYCIGIVFSLESLK